MVAKAASETLNGQSHGHPLYTTVEDHIRSVVVAWDAFTLATGEKKLPRAERVSSMIRHLGQKLEYDRGCQQMLEWSPLHVLANRLWKAWMLCMLNGSRMTDDEVGDLDEAVQNAKRWLNEQGATPNK